MEMFRKIYAMKIVLESRSGSFSSFLMRAASREVSACKPESSSWLREKKATSEPETLALTMVSTRVSAASMKSVADHEPENISENMCE